MRQGRSDCHIHYICLRSERYLDPPVAQTSSRHNPAQKQPLPTPSLINPVRESQRTIFPRFKNTYSTQEPWAATRNRSWKLRWKNFGGPSVHWLRNTKRRFATRSTTNRSGGTTTPSCAYIRLPARKRFPLLPLGPFLVAPVPRYCCASRLNVPLTRKVLHDYESNGLEENSCTIGPIACIKEVHRSAWPRSCNCFCWKKNFQVQHKPVGIIVFLLATILSIICLFIVIPL
jgi:hypothetical protein